MKAVGTGYLRHPTIAGDTVVFCSADALWQVSAAGGTASRLTNGVEHSYPRLSPDGELVAFVGADDGPTEVYVMPLASGPAHRLTFQAARCTVVGWHPSRMEIIYASTAEQPAGHPAQLFAVSLYGGPPRPLGYGPASALCYGPGGAMALGRSIADPARRKRYRGGAAGEVWVDPNGAGQFRRLPLPGNVADPCWVGDRIYFISDHEDTGNVYSCRIDGDDLIRHTDHRDFYARSLRSDGQRLVYHAGGELFLLDPAAGRCQRLEVHLAGVRGQHHRRFVSAGKFLDHAQLRPDGTGVAMVVRGQAITMAPWSGPVRRHNAVPGTRHRLLSWLAGGQRLIAVASDDRRDERLVVLPASGGPAEIELPLDDHGYVTELAASPAAAQVAFATNRQQLWTVNLDELRPTPQLLDTSRFDRIEDLAWSPDGRWLAYTFPDSAHSSAIKLAEVAARRTFQVTQPVIRDARPAFDPAGRYLYFIGQRDVTPEHDQVEFSIGFPFGARPYLVTLRADEPPPFLKGPPGSKPDRGGSLLGDSAEPPVRVDIDLTDIDRRVTPIPVPEGRYASVIGLPDKVLLHSVPVAAPDPATPERPPDGTVIAVDLVTAEVTEEYLSVVDEISVSADLRTLLYRSRDRLRVLDVEAVEEAAAELPPPCAPPSPRTGWLDLDRIRLSVHPAAEWRQMYREAWRLQRESYWHAGMSGLDWDALYERYLPLVGLVATRSELSDLLWELQGELATSHAYEWGGDYHRPHGQAQGFLGVDWAIGAESYDGASRNRRFGEEPICDQSLVRSGGGGPIRWRIERIVRGELWNPRTTSPCNRPGVDLRPGDAIIAVDGQPVGPAGPGELLVGLADQEVELTVLREGSAPRRVVVRAAAGEERARYLDWVADNRRYVRSRSGDRLGYLHVPDMFRTGYADFVRGFRSELDREGLIVDVRFNGGGQVSPLLLDRLARRRVGAEHGRWSGVAPYPSEAPNGPMVLLINEHTGSDAELFSHMFRQLGLGALIGTRTWGGTIATWPRHELVDGTVTTQPEFCYVFPDVGHGLENHGVEPDLLIEVPPGGDRPGFDRQLAGAVEYLLGELGRATRPTAGVPVDLRPGSPVPAFANVEGG